MKKILSVIILSFLTISAFAQNGITKFMGIPVDGTKQEMIKKLEAKGFIYNSESDALNGEFNGEDVNIYIVTDNNKVWRIAVFDQNTRDEYQTKLRFNTLFDQFSRNGRYLPYTNERIPQEEDISTEMSLHEKRYEASFIQFSGIKNVPQFIYNCYEPIQDQKSLDFTKLSCYSKLTEQDQKNFTALSKLCDSHTKRYFEKMQSSIDSLYIEDDLTFESLNNLESETHFKELMAPLGTWVENSPKESTDLSKEEQNQMMKEFALILQQFIDQINNDNRPKLDFDWMRNNNSVWFCIDNNTSWGYRIQMFYDNINNQSHGEDL